MAGKDPIIANKIILRGDVGGGIFTSNGTSIIDKDGNVDAPVTSTDLTLSGTLAVTGASTLSSTVGIGGNVAVNTNKFNITAASGNTTIAGTLGVTGDVSVNTDKFTVTAASGNTLVAGTFDATGDVAVNTDKFNVTAASGNTTVAGTLGVTGVSTLTGGATVGGALIQGGTGAITSTSGAGAVAITGQIHEVTTTGTGDALTLADGTAGQRLAVIYVAEGAGGDTAIITPTTLAGGSTITLNALGDSCDLVFSSTGGWYVLGLGGTAAVA